MRHTTSGTPRAAHHEKKNARLRPFLRTWCNQSKQCQCSPQLFPSPGQSRNNISFAEDWSMGENDELRVARGAMKHCQRNQLSRRSPSALVQHIPVFAAIAQLLQIHQKYPEMSFSQRGARCELKKNKRERRLSLL